MSKHVRKILPLLLCLLLMACLLPAAYADGVEVSTLAELQAALNNSQNCVSTGEIGGPGSGIELTVPTGVTLNITSGFVCVSSMTVNGNVNVGDNGMLMVDQSLTGSGEINVAAGCKTFNLPAACYDSESHALVSLIHNSSDNVTLVHTPANQAELRSALLKAEDAANYGIDSGILIAQDLTISQNEEVLLGNMVLSVQYGATLTLDDHAVVVTKQDVMVEQSSIHVRGGAVLDASVQLNASTIDFSNGGGFFGKRFRVRNTEDPAACIRGLDLTRAKRINEVSQTIFEFDLNEPIYGGDPTVDSELALQNAITAFNQLREQDPSARIDVYTSGNFAITGNITIPDGFQLRCRNNLTIAADAVVTVDGKLDAIEGGHVSILGTVINNNQFRMFDTGVMELSGTLVNNHDVCYKRVSTDRTHLVINSGATFTNNSNFAIADDLVRDPAVLGVDVNGYCVARMWDEPDMSRYFAPEVFDHFEGMCSSGKFVYLELHGVEEVSIAESMNIPENMTVEMGETTLVVPSGFTLTVNGELVVKELVIESGGSVTVNESGYLDIGGGGFNILNGGTLTLNNTRIDAPYPRSNPDTLENIVYNGGEAGVILHLNIGNPDGVADVFAAASEASSARVNCIVELRTDWTMTGTINAPDVAFEIPEEYTVTVNGDLTIGEIRSWGTINLNEKGRLSPSDMSLNGVINVVGKDARLNEVKLHDLVNGRPRGSVTVADASARVFFRGDGLDEALLPEWITLQGSETEARICYRADNEQDFVGMTGAISSLPAGFVGSLRVQYPAVIQGNVDFPGAELRIEGKKGGSLTIAEGATLTARNVNLHSADMTVSGTFIAGPSYRHGGSVTMNSDDGNNSTLIVTDTGILGGYQCTVEVPKGIETASCVFGFNPGQMKDVSHPYRPNYQIYLIVAEMSLPSGLTTIESEAFAGGSFNSVYIPNSVTSIAFDAFGDRTDLKVYGEYGTAAETFAHDHGFPFAPPNLATQPA